MEVLNTKGATKTRQSGWMRQFSCTGEGNGGCGCGEPLLVSQRDFYKKSMSLNESKATGYEKKMTFCCPCCGVETDVDAPHATPFDLFALGIRPSLNKRETMSVS